MSGKQVTITLPLDTPDARQSAALACGYPDWRALVDAAQAEAPGPLDPDLAAYLDWPLYFLDSSAPYCNKFPACTNPECCDPCSGSVPIASARRMTVREFLADIKAHAEGQP